MFNFLFGAKKNNQGVQILFDMGGTKTRVARSSAGGFEDVRIEATPKDPVEGLKKLIALSREVAGRKRIAGVTGCIAGGIDKKGVVHNARNLTSWEGKNIVEGLKAGLGAPASVLNDGALVGLGEYVDGAGKGSHCMAYITISTGVGGALIRDGAIDFEASELQVGRIPLHYSDFESEVSGTAIRKKFGIEPYELDSIEERNNIADQIAQGLVAVVNAWKPDTIVLGGSMMVGKRNTIPLEQIIQKLQMLMGGTIPEIKLAELKDLGGLHGARALANQK